MPDDNTPPARHPELSFDDANVIFVASDSPIQFYLHKGVVSAHSSVFAEMFTMPVPADAETHNGLPIVRLPDEYADLEVFFQFMYGKMFLPAESFLSGSARAMLRPFKLAAKYEFDALKGQILKKLASDWPDTLEEWDRREEEVYLEKRRTFDFMYHCLDHITDICDITYNHGPQFVVNMLHSTACIGDAPRAFALALYQLAFSHHLIGDIEAGVLSDDIRQSRGIRSSTFSGRIYRTSERRRHSKNVTSLNASSPCSGFTCGGNSMRRTWTLCARCGKPPERIHRRSSSSAPNVLTRHWELFPILDNSSLTAFRHSSVSSEGAECSSVIDS
ncbi:hypothetical protein HGRIS_013587 [Hohenbuehelia grisea]|uniref:BTB domain-containing protein n=1 Tax=Hohenbuehelia grisea TaxID=104357 RepID=A0ABR3IW10_9AGAR